MALFKISEPNQIIGDFEKKTVVGIDLGTTNSLIAYLNNQEDISFVKDKEGNVVFPSVVYYGESETLVGQDAEKKLIIDPENTISSVKRIMGRGIHDISKILPYQLVELDNKMPYIKTRQGNMSPVQVSAKILQTLVKHAENTLGQPIVGAVITVPAYFDETQRQATQDAAKLIGLNVYRLLSEPTAAAIAYGLDKKSSATVAIYDLGGGTFDVSILRLEQGVFKVLATSGDTRLGGDDFDYSLAFWIANQADIDIKSLQPIELKKLFVEARRIKEQLSLIDKVDINWLHVVGIITRYKFNSLIEEAIDTSLKIFKGALKDAHCDKLELDEVVMVGGSTRIPLIREKIKLLIGKSPLTSIDPDKVVVEGAAIQADILAGNQKDTDLLLLDVIPLSLGLETMGGLMEKVIYRNTTIPIAKAQEFTTYMDGQTSMAINVYQGERDLIADNRFLGNFELKGIPPMLAGVAKIRVIFQVDADGLLNVIATETSTGISSHIEVKPAYGLTDLQITNMIENSHNYASSDKKNRHSLEQRLEADRLIVHLKSALMHDGDDLLTKEEYQKLLDVINDLNDVSQSNNADAIRSEIEKANVASEKFAELRMNKSIQEALSGKNVNDF